MFLISMFQNRFMAQITLLNISLMQTFFQFYHNQVFFQLTLFYSFYASQIDNRGLFFLGEGIGKESKEENVRYSNKKVKRNKRFTWLTTKTKRQLQIQGVTWDECCRLCDSAWAHAFASLLDRAMFEPCPVSESTVVRSLAKLCSCSVILFTVLDINYSKEERIKLYERYSDHRTLFINSFDNDIITMDDADGHNYKNKQKIQKQKKHQLTRDLTIVQRLLFTQKQKKGPFAKKRGFFKEKKKSIKEFFFFILFCKITAQ